MLPFLIAAELGYRHFFRRRISAHEYLISIGLSLDTQAEA